MLEQQESMDYRSVTYDQFLSGNKTELDEIKRFNEWIDFFTKNEICAFESIHFGGTPTETTVQRNYLPNVPKFGVVHFGSYNYLGFGCHPEVKKAAQTAIEQYGTGAYSSPILNGTLKVHRELEESLIEFFGMKDHGVSLFSSGYGVCQGTVQAFCKPGNVVLLDEKAHVSMTDGARASGAQAIFFKHNDTADLEFLLKRYQGKRILICVEGVYSTDGDFSPLADIVSLAKRYGAYTLVDEAHAVLIAGKNGRGASEELGVLNEIDLYVMTFSKSFGGAGGALLAKKEITRYVNYYARCRSYSCALDPGISGALIKVIELVSGTEGQQRRMRIKANVKTLREKVSQYFSINSYGTWIVPVIFGSERYSFDIFDSIQRQGLDASLHTFPAVAKDNARIRLFVSSEHTQEQMDRCVDVLVKISERFSFKSRLKNN